MSKESFPTTSFPTDGSEQSTFVELLLADFSAVLNRENEPLIENREYMQLTELKFLIKNIRELTAIQLFQSYSRSDTITIKPSSDTNDSTALLNATSGSMGYADMSSGCGYDSHQDTAAAAAARERAFRGSSLDSQHQNEPVMKRACTDRLLLFNKRLKIDAILADLKTYVAKRLALAQPQSQSQSQPKGSSGSDQNTKKIKGTKGKAFCALLMNYVNECGFSVEVIIECDKCVVTSRIHFLIAFTSFTYFI